MKTQTTLILYDITKPGVFTTLISDVEKEADNLKVREKALKQQTSATPPL
jgi:hypothetical protein